MRIINLSDKSSITLSDEQIKTARQMGCTEIILVTHKKIPVDADPSWIEDYAEGCAEDVLTMNAGEDVVNICPHGKPDFAIALVDAIRVQDPHVRVMFNILDDK